MSILTILVTLCTRNLTTLYCLYQSITRPTHVHHNDSELTMDLVFVSESSLLNTCDTIPPLSSSDHRGILMEISRKVVKAEKTRGRLIWRYAMLCYAMVTQIGIKL